VSTGRRGCFKDIRRCFAIQSADWHLPMQPCNRHANECSKRRVNHCWEEPEGSVPLCTLYPDVGRLSKKLFMSANALAWPYTTAVCSLPSSSAVSTDRGEIASRHTEAQSSTTNAPERRPPGRAQTLGLRASTDGDAFIANDPETLFVLTVNSESCGRSRVDRGPFRKFSNPQTR
jgi:hypothetical protein